MRSQVLYAAQYCGIYAFNGRVVAPKTVDILISIGFRLGL